jgi:hypothetical protein
MGGYCLLLAILTAGCNQSGIDLAPVSGVVTFEGKPVVDAGVRFVPTESSKGPPASGATDEEGRFTLMTANQEGAVVGEHRVAIAKTDVVAIPQRHGLPLYKITERLPKKYSNYTTSDIAVTVKDDDNMFTFDLTEE